MLTQVHLWLAYTVRFKNLKVVLISGPGLGLQKYIITAPLDKLDQNKHLYKLNQLFIVIIVQSLWFDIKVILPIDKNRITFIITQYSIVVIFV